jgi:hypothetical protein
LQGWPDKVHTYIIFSSLVFFNSLMTAACYSLHEEQLPIFSDF